MACRIGNRNSVDHLARYHTELSFVKLGEDRDTVLISDFDDPQYHVRLLSWLTRRIQLGRRVGIVMCMTVLVQYSTIFHTVLETALKTSKIPLYSLAYRALDPATGSQSITDVKITKGGDIIYTSSIGGPLDTISSAHFQILPSVTVLKLDPPTQQIYYTDAEYHSNVLKSLSSGVFSNSQACRLLRHICVPPKVLLFGDALSQPSLLDLLAVWKDDLPLQSIKFTGNFDRSLIEVLNGRSLKHAVHKALPSLTKLDESTL